MKKVARRRVLCSGITNGEIIVSLRLENSVDEEYW